VVIAAFGVDPIRLLFLASIAGGFATPIGLAFLLLIASDRSTMRGHPVRGGLRLIGWLVTVAIAGISLVYLVRQVTGS
jgi:Mn2+/Fe2+ NRAMP family transporter